MNNMEFLHGRLIVETGDITVKAVDGIVNAANSSLLGGGGVDGAIHRKGGPAIVEACRKLRRGQYGRGLPAGQAVATTAGNLPARYVIHTVGPVWQGGQSGEEELLRECYFNSLVLSAELGLESVAFPAISTGIYGFPREKAAGIVFSTIKAFLESRDKPEKVYLIFFSGEDLQCFLEHRGAGKA